MRTLLGLILAFSLCSLAGSAGAANVTGIPDDLDELELFATPDAPDAAATVRAGEVRFPIPILAVSEAAGMLQINVKGGNYWVISDDVLTDLTRGIDAGCEPKMAGSLVVHGKRGAGEGCK